MADWDIPPRDLTDSHFGRIIRRQSSLETSYKLTPLDYCYIAFGAAHEEHAHPWLITWAIMQRFAGYHLSLWPPSVDAVGSLKRCCELYCAPLNPTFAYEGAPGPQRATRGFDCSRISRQYTGIGQGLGSPEGPSINGEPVPGKPASRRWNLVQCSSGRRPRSHGNDSQNANRRRRFEQIRNAMGLGGNAEQAWTSLSPRARRSTWMIFRGLVGNPIPGFDDWEALSDEAEAEARRRGRVLPEVEAGQRARIINSAGRPGTKTPWVLAAGRASDGRYRGTTNRYNYRSYLQSGQIRIEFEENGHSRRSDRAEIEVGHYTGARSSVAYNPSGSVVVTTRSGLAESPSQPVQSVSQSVESPPQLARPAVGEEEVSAATSAPSSRSSSNVVTISRSESQLGSESELLSNLETWADHMEQELTREFGVGIRRR